MLVKVSIVLFSSLWAVSSGGYGSGGAPPECAGFEAGTPSAGEDPNVPDLATYNAALSTLNLRDVFDDLYDLMTDGDDCWPPDEFNGKSSYVGLFLRLAWHAAGTFRATDNEGGAAGGRMRYPPEATWMDNANLEEARALLAPIKEKYGDALSWADLMVFAGTAAIGRGGGPITRVCAGRIDDMDGSGSDVLNDDASCNIQGNCSEPLGSSTVGLIYVNPQGYLGIPDPERTAIQVREIFGRMGMNDYESVALIGGGHAFGKCHGPCINPVDGRCGNNLPSDAHTSGIEGAWTTYPFEWDNEYFTQLYFDDYTLGIGPGGAYQWTNNRNGLLMLTTDIAFVNDNNYLNIVQEFATNQQSLDYYFSNTWQKLTEMDLNIPGKWSSNYFCETGRRLRYKRNQGGDGSSSSGGKGGNSDSDSSSSGGKGGKGSDSDSSDGY